MNNKPSRAAVILGAALLLGPNLTARNLIPGGSTCETLTAGGGRGGSSGRSGGGSKTKPKTVTKPKTGSGTKPHTTGHHDSSDDCDDD